MKTIFAAAAIALAIGSGSAHACPTLVSAVLSVSVLTATSANTALGSVDASQSVYDTILNVASLANADAHHTYSSSNNVADPSMTNATAAGALGAVLMSSRKFGHPKAGRTVAHSGWAVAMLPITN
jgi:hypothetical protein